MPRTPTIELDLITTDGMRLCRLEVDFNHFREANAHTSEERMLKHLSALLPQGVRFTDQVRRSLRGPLAQLRGRRQPVRLRDVVVEKHAVDTRAPPQPLPPSAQVVRYRAQRDQARAELKTTRSERDDYRQRLDSAEENNKTLTRENADLSARNSQLRGQVEELRAKNETYLGKLQQTAADLREYRERLRDCQGRLKRLRPSDPGEMEDRFG